MRGMVMGLAALAAGAAAVGAERRPNIIVFYADDLGNGDVGCYGAKDIRTPHIDALAETGVRFTNYYAAAPICAPSRGSLLTGRYPERCGMSSTRNVASEMDAAGLSGEEVTFAEVAKSKGYATAAFGKWHLGSTYDTQPNAQGFDLFVGHHASQIDSFSHMYYASEPWYHDLYRNRQEIFEDGVHMVDIITREATAFIDAAGDKPFLMYVAYNVPHYPMVAKAKFFEMYQDLPRLRRIHAAMVTMMDDSIGQIMGRLSERGLVENTFVFFSSDNGAANLSMRGEGGGSNAPYREYKRSLFDGGERLPAIVSQPGVVPAGQTRDQLAIGMDVFSTIMELVGAEAPAYRVIDGMSWMGLLKDASQPGHEVLFFEWDNQHAVRSGPWKLVANGLMDMYMSRQNRPDPKSEDYLFLANTEEDPGENVNQRGQHPEVVGKLLKMHADWRRSVMTDPTSSPSFDTRTAKKAE